MRTGLLEQEVCSCCFCFGYLCFFVVFSAVLEIYERHLLVLNRRLDDCGFSANLVILKSCWMNGLMQKLAQL